MKGVILAGGTGSRLGPLCKTINKHLLPVGNQPMIYYAVQKLVEAHITQIMVITGVEHAGSIISSLGSGKEFGCQFTYKVQDDAGGIAQALGLAEDFCRGEKFCVLLGDNIFESTLERLVDAFQWNHLDGEAVILAHQVDNPSRYGVIEFKNLICDIVSIEEKPVNPKSDYIVTGIYLYDSFVFDVIRTLKPSKRGELEITDVNNYYLKEDKLDFYVLSGWWTDAGTFESLQAANQYVTDPRRKSK